MSELEELITEWLPIPDVAERLGLPLKKVHSLIDDRTVLAARVGERNIRCIPALFLVDDHVLESLKGTISLLTFAYGSVLIVSGNWAARRLRNNESVGRWLSRFAGVALIGFGARLATG